MLEAFCEELTAGVAAALADGGIAGVWLALHGAGVTTECSDAEGEILARLRRVPGAESLPVFGVFDLHADLMGRHADALVGYRENPHTDARAAAILSAQLLARGLRDGVLPRMHVRRMPLIWPPTGTANTPMRELEALARLIEATNTDIWAINVVAGFSFSDVPDAGLASSVAGGLPPRRRRQPADRLLPRHGANDPRPQPRRGAGGRRPPARRWHPLRRADRGRGRGGGTRLRDGPLRREAPLRQLRL